MRQTDNLPMAPDVTLTTQGQFPGIEEYVQEKIGGLSRLAHRPVLHVRVRLTKVSNPAVANAVLAQANLDVNGRSLRAQVDADNPRAAIDLLEARLRRQLEHIAGAPRRWRHEGEPEGRLRRLSKPGDQHRIIRRKSFTLGACSVDEAAEEMDLLDYDFHLFTEKGTKQASVLYRAGTTGYRLAQVQPAIDQLARFDLPVTFSPQPAPVLTLARAAERLELAGPPFLFFIDPDQGRAGVLYHRYDGHYGLLSPAG
ncbi:MAG: HPF/RaiA family ribosome-associated protein [Mycobacterium sp.]